MIPGEREGRAVVLLAVVDGSSAETRSSAVQGGGTVATVSMRWRLGGA